MHIKFLVPTVAALGLLTTVSGCTTAVGAAGSALAGSAASGALASGGNKARFARQSCEELNSKYRPLVSMNGNPDRNTGALTKKICLNNYLVSVY